MRGPASVVPTRPQLDGAPAAVPPGVDSLTCGDDKPRTAQDVAVGRTRRHCRPGERFEAAPHEAAEASVVKRDQLASGRGHRQDVLLACRQVVAPDALTVEIKNVPRRGASQTSFVQAQVDVAPLRSPGPGCVATPEERIRRNPEHIVQDRKAPNDDLCRRLERHLVVDVAPITVVVAVVIFLLVGITRHPLPRRVEIEANESTVNQLA